MSAARLAVLLSGRGSNLRALAAAIEAGRLRAEIVAVGSDRAEAAGVRWAQEQGLPVHVCERSKHASRADFEAALFAPIVAAAPHWVILAGFMRVLSPECVRAWRGRMINLHPSLLPAHPGLETHRKAIEAGDREHGASVHFVTEVLDGGPVVAQVAFPMPEAATAAALAQRLLPLEHALLVSVVGWLADGRLTLDPTAERVLWDGQPQHQPRRLRAA